MLGVQVGVIKAAMLVFTQLLSHRLKVRVIQPLFLHHLKHQYLAGKG